MAGKLDWKGVMYDLALGWVYHAFAAKPSPVAV
jgi:hypothetical protein